MRTPAGEMCPHYYEDFHRGRETQECRLVAQNPRSLRWTPDICGKCPVPSILRANGSPNLRLEVTIRKRFGLFRTVDVDAYCIKHAREVGDPYVGCSECVDEMPDLGL
jgi:hypothetical protein